MLRGSIDATEGHIRPSEVPYFRVFRAFSRQRQQPEESLKIALSEQINRSDRRARQAIWMPAGPVSGLDNSRLWLHQQGFDFEMISGVESHDIGDQDYFRGSRATNDVDKIVDFVKKLYGEWSLQSVFHGISIRVEKRFPNIYHGISFYYPGMAEEAMSHLFSEFQKKFCYHAIRIQEESR